MKTNQVKFIDAKEASILSVILIYTKEGLKVPQYLLKKLKSKIAIDISNVLLKRSSCSIWVRRIVRELTRKYDQ